MNGNDYISPPINPGTRRWCGTEPERHVVNYSYQSRPNANLAAMMGTRILPCGCPMGCPSCGYPSPHSPPTGGERVEGFGGQMDMDSLLKILVLVAVLYFLYQATQKN